MNLKRQKEVQDEISKIYPKWEFSPNLTSKESKLAKAKIKELSKKYTGYELKVEKVGEAYQVKQANNPNGGMAYFAEPDLKTANEDLFVMRKMYEADVYEKYFRKSEAMN